MSDKKTKKTADDTRNSQNRRCDAYNYFCRAALEAKNAQVTNENANSNGPQKRQTSETNDQQSDKSEQ